MLNFIVNFVWNYMLSYEFKREYLAKKIEKLNKKIKTTDNQAYEHTAVPEEENKFVDYDEVRLIKLPSIQKPEPVEIAIESIELVEEIPYFSFWKVHYTFKGICLWIELSFSQARLDGSWSHAQIPCQDNCYDWKCENYLKWKELTTHEKNRIYFIIKEHLTYTACMELLEKQKQGMERTV